jgi:hypothetical protein
VAGAPHRRDRSEAREPPGPGGLPEVQPRRADHRLHGELRREHGPVHDPRRRRGRGVPRDAPPDGRATDRLDARRGPDVPRVGLRRSRADADAAHRRRRRRAAREAPGALRGQRGDQPRRDVARLLPPPARLPHLEAIPRRHGDRHLAVQPRLVRVASRSPTGRAPTPSRCGTGARCTTSPTPGPRTAEHLVLRAVHRAARPGHVLRGLRRQVPIDRPGHEQPRRDRVPERAVAPPARPPATSPARSRSRSSRATARAPPAQRSTRRTSPAGTSRHRASAPSSRPAATSGPSRPTTARAPATSPTPAAWPSAPGWSPDGRWIAYFSDETASTSSTSPSPTARARPAS